MGNTSENKEIKELILLNIDDLVSNFTYYDRKEDEELTEALLDESVKTKQITIDEMVERFRIGLIEVFGDN